MNTETDPLSDDACRAANPCTTEIGIIAFEVGWQECARRAKRYKDQLFIANAHYNESERENKRLRELLKRLLGVSETFLSLPALEVIRRTTLWKEARAALEGKE